MRGTNVNSSASVRLYRHGLAWQAYKRKEEKARWFLLLILYISVFIKLICVEHVKKDVLSVKCIPLLTWFWIVAAYMRVEADKRSRPSPAISSLLH